MQNIEALSAIIVAMTALGTLALGFWQYSATRQEKQLDLLHTFKTQVASNLVILGGQARQAGDLALAKHYFLKALDHYAAMADKSNEYIINGYLKEIDDDLGALQERQRPNLRLIHAPQLVEPDSQEVSLLYQPDTAASDDMQPTQPKQRIVS